MADNNSTSFALTLPSLTQSADGDVWDTGSITQSLAFLSQSSSGLSLFETINAVATARSVFGFDQLVESYTVVTDLLSAEFTNLETSVISATGTPTFDVVIELEEAAAASEALTTNWTTTLAPKSGKASESIAQEISLLVTGAAYITNAFEFGRPGNLLTGAATATEAIDPGVINYQLETGNIRADDSIIIGGSAAFTFTANASEEITHYNVPTETVTGVANGVATETFWGTVTESLTSTAQGDYTLDFAGSTYNNTLSSTANVSEWMWAKDFNAIAWVLNTQSGGVSSYDNFGFTSIAFHAGKLYATSPEGLFELDADNDDGRKIDAVVKGGFLDFGTDEKKRMSDIYVGYTGGDLECDVETYDGPEEVYTYGMEYRDADAPRNNRLKVGRGLSSRYWRLAFKNIGGADFQIYDVTLNIATSKRRL